MTVVRTAQRSLLADPNLRIIFLVTLMAVLGVSSVTPAFPQIVRALDISKPSVGLLIMVFTMPGIVLAPFLGVLADRHGRKTVLVPALLLFAAAGGACFFAREFTTLLILRFFQGCGASALGVINVTLIGDLFSGKERAAAMGYNASVLSIATASYPFIGGILTGFGWRYVFLLPLLAVPIGLVILFKLQSPKPQHRQRLGLYLHSAADSLKNRAAILYFSSGLMVFILLYGPPLTYVPILLAEKFGATPVQIGLVFSGMSVMTAITAAQAGRMVRIMGAHRMLTISFVFYACALGLLPIIPKLWMMALPTAVYGIGQGLNMPSAQTLLTGLAPIEYRAAFMSINGMVLRLGQTLGPLIAGAVFITAGIRATFFVGAILALFMFAALMVLAKEPAGNV